MLLPVQASSAAEESPHEPDVRMLVPEVDGAEVVGEAGDPVGLTGVAVGDVEGVGDVAEAEDEGVEVGEGVGEGVHVGVSVGVGVGDGVVHDGAFTAISRRSVVLSVPGLRTLTESPTAPESGTAVTMRARPSAATARTQDPSVRPSSHESSGTRMMRGSRAAIT
jgi:hypothetical protein